MIDGTAGTRRDSAGPVAEPTACRTDAEAAPGQTPEGQRALQSQPCSGRRAATGTLREGQ